MPMHVPPPLSHRSTMALSDTSLLVCNWLSPSLQNIIISKELNAFSNIVSKSN